VTTRDLDRLVSKTEITPASKRALREVRTAVMSGYVGDPVVGGAKWSVGIESRNGQAVKMTFAFRRD